MAVPTQREYKGYIIFLIFPYIPYIPSTYLRDGNEITYRLIVRLTFHFIPADCETHPHQESS